MRIIGKSPKIHLNTILSVILGHAIADALGVPAEFMSREQLRGDRAIADMVGGGAHKMHAGTWSDDTSMSICALDALSSGICDFDLVMQNFCKWMYESDYTATGKVFDVGGTCLQAIYNYKNNGLSYLECGERTENSNGNGSLMRINPFVLFLLAKNGKIDSEGEELIRIASGLTHAHPRSVVGCLIYAYVLESIITKPKRSSVIKGLNKAKKNLAQEEEFEHYNRLFETDFGFLKEEDISSGGYVVYTLEAALWCLLNSDSYQECVLKAVNLGDDTDTVAAVVGGLAGAMYGIDSIPNDWLKALAKKEYLEEMCQRAFDAWK